MVLVRFTPTSSMVAVFVFSEIPSAMDIQDVFGLSISADVTTLMGHARNLRRMAPGSQRSLTVLARIL